MEAIIERQLCGLDGLPIAGLAGRYCALIRAAGEDDCDWLRPILNLLPPLHAAIFSVQVAESATAPVCGVDLDRRFDLFARLRLILGDRDGYWLEFDRLSDGPAGMTGSLADDLTDIYCELESGLALYAQSPESALEAWVCGFHCHWGRHLVDAERHLALLAANGRLDR